MVYYRLKEKDERCIRYEYFPEKHMECAPGIIIVDTGGNTIEIEKLADEDFAVAHSVQEQNELRDSVNAVRMEDGQPALTEEEWPSATAEMQYAAYGSHAIHDLLKKLNAGEIPNEGMEMWY
jgi:hypothetical protein